MPETRLIDATRLHAQVSNDNGGDLSKTENVAQILLRIENAPTIDAQPVKYGKWEWEPGYVGTTAKCSVCGLSPMGFYSLPIIQIGRLPEYPFCPKCGAKMDGGDADENS